MAENALDPSLYLNYFHRGDPPIILEGILKEVGEGQQKQVIALYLDSLAAVHQANLNLVQGLRGMVAGAARAQGRS